MPSITAPPLPGLQITPSVQNRRMEENESDQRAERPRDYCPHSAQIGLYKLLDCLSYQLGDLQIEPLFSLESFIGYMFL